MSFGKTNPKLFSLVLALLLVFACSVDSVMAVDQSLLNDQKVLGPQTTEQTVKQTTGVSVPVSSSSDTLIVDSSAEEDTPAVTEAKMETSSMSAKQQPEQSQATRILQEAEREYVDSSDNEEVVRDNTPTPAAQETKDSQTKVEADASLLDSTDSEIATEDQKDSSEEEEANAKATEQEQPAAAAQQESKESVDAVEQTSEQLSVNADEADAVQVDDHESQEEDSFDSGYNAMESNDNEEAKDDGLDLEDSDLDQGVVPHHGMHAKRKTTSKTAGDAAGAAAADNTNHGVWLTGKAHDSDQGEMENEDSDLDDDVQYDDVNFEDDQQESFDEDNNMYDDNDDQYDDQTQNQNQYDEDDFNDVSDSQIASEDAGDIQDGDDTEEIQDSEAQESQQEEKSFSNMISDSDQNEPTLPKDVQFLRDSLIASNSEEEKLSSSESNAHRLKSYDTAMQYDGLRQELKSEIGDSDEANRDVNNMTPADVRKHLKTSVRQLHKQTALDAKQLKTKLEKLRKRIQSRILASEHDQHKTLKGVRVFILSGRKLNQAIAQHKHMIDQKSVSYHRAHNRLASSMHVWKQWYAKHLASYRRRRNRLQQVVNHHRMFTQKCKEMGKSTGALCLTIYNRVKQLNGQIGSMMKVLASKIDGKRTRTTQVLNQIKKAMLKHHRKRQQRVAHLVSGMNTLESKLARRKEHIKQAKTALETRTKQLAALNQQDRRVARAFRNTHAAMIKRRENLLARAHKLLQELKVEQNKTE